MPLPLIRRWGTFCELPVWIELAGQPAPVEKRNEMAAISTAIIETFLDKNGRRIEFNCSAELTLGNDSNPVTGRFFITDDSARHMPSWTVKLVAPPGKQGSRAIVSYQQININEWRVAAYKKK